MTDRPAIQPGYNTFLLLEKKEGVAIHQKLYELMGDPQWVPLFAETRWTHCMEETPLLIQASPETAFYQWARKAMADEDGLRGLLIESRYALSLVAEWARKRLAVSFDGNRTGLLRFYDPQVWHTLAAKQGQENSPVARIHYWHDHWRISEHPEIAVPG